MMLKWLVDTHCCPINHYNKYSKGAKKRNRIGKEAIVTSKGHSVLTLAMDTESLSIQRYLIVEKKVNIFDYSNPRKALQNLANCLLQLPESPNHHD